MRSVDVAATTLQRELSCTTAAGRANAFFICMCIYLTTFLRSESGRRMVGGWRRAQSNCHDVTACFALLVLRHVRWGFSIFVPITAYTYHVLRGFSFRFTLKSRSLIDTHEE